MKIHFIAIGGSVMHQMAIALKRKGFEVSGSDDDIFDPARANLLAHDLLPIEKGWQPNRITKDLDAIILGMHARKNNPELLKAQALNIPIYCFPAYIYEQSKDKKRVVVGGSHGKTTISSMIIYALQKNNYDFDCLVGAIPRGLDYAVQLSEKAPIIVIEGDEYLSSPLHRIPKFHFYKANIAILSGIAWDHINVFPTYENYLSQFEGYLQSIPEDGVLIYNAQDEAVVQLVKKHPYLCQIAYNLPEYQIKDGKYQVKVAEQWITLSVFGEHNLQNLCAAQLACEQLGLSAKDFWYSIADFKGAARRLELVATYPHAQFYKDFAHAPSKVKATTKAVRSLYPDRKLFACLELHTYSSLNKAFLPHYHQALQNAHEAVVFYNPHTLKIKKLPPIAAEDIHKAFEHSNLKVFTTQAELSAHLKTINYVNTNLLMMSSGNFGGLDLQALSQIVGQVNE